MRKIKLFLILVTIASTALAQDGFEKNIYIGAKGISMFSKMRFYPNVDQSTYIGYGGGAVFRMISEPRIGIQIEANYERRGWKESFEAPDVAYSRILNYLELPMMTYISFLGKKTFQCFFNIGPSISFLLSENETFTYTTETPDEEWVKEYYGEPIDAKTDIQFTAGLGAEAHLKNNSIIVFEMRGSISLPNTFDDSVYRYSASRSQIAKVTLAYLFKVN